MSKRSFLVSATLHAAAISAASAYFLPHLADTQGKATTVIPVEFVTIAEPSVAVQVRQDHPTPPTTQPIAEVAPPTWNIGASAVLEPVEVEAPPPELERAPEPSHALAQAVQEFSALSSAPETTSVDSDDRELKLPETVAVRHQGLKLHLEVLGDVLFELDSAELRPEAQVLIGSIASALGSYGFTFIDVKGFTDTSGTAEHNRQLSADRASAVAEELARDGIDLRRIRASGYGTNELAVPTPEGIREARNRRVEIVLDSQE